MVLPTINFSGVNKVIYSGQEMSKVYCGIDLLWERKAMSNSITLYTSRQLSMYSETLYFEKVDQRITKDNIYKIVLMDKYEIQGDKVSRVFIDISPQRIDFTSDFNTLVGINEFIPYNTKVEVYLK